MVFLSLNATVYYCQPLGPEIIIIKRIKHIKKHNIFKHVLSLMQETKIIDFKKTSQSRKMFSLTTVNNRVLRAVFVRAP